VKALDRIEANLGATLFPEGGQGGGINYLFILLAIGSLAGGIWAARRLMSIPPWGNSAPAGAPAKALGGLLWLFAIGLVIRPALYLKEIWGFKYLVFQVSWKSLTAQGSESYHPLWEPALIASTAVTLLGLCLSFALLPIFFRRRANFPAAFAIASGVAVFGLALDQAAGFLIPSLKGEMTGAESPAAALRATAIAIAWAVYLFRGSRPRETFVVTVGARSGVGSRAGETDPPIREKDVQAA